MLATPSSIARVFASCCWSPRIPAIQLWPPRKRCEATVPPCAATSSAPAVSGSMWQSMQVFFSTLSTRPAPLPVYAELRQKVGSSMPDMWTGTSTSGLRKPRWQPTHSSEPSSSTVACSRCACTDAGSSTSGVPIGARASTHEPLPSLVT